MRSLAIVVVLALSSVLVACGERSDSPIKTGTTGSMANPAAGVPPAAPDRESPPAPTPTTHAQAPQPEASWTGLSTARDTPAQEPAKELSKGEETYSMPKPGQSDNHFSPSIDGAIKGSQQSPGTAAPEAPAPAK
jgi:hypothetical protein